MLKKLRDLRFWFTFAIPLGATYLSLAWLFGARLGLRFTHVLDVVSFLLLVVVPAVLVGLLTMGVGLIGEYGWIWWQERKKAKNPGYQLFLLVDEIEQCRCLLRSIKASMTAEELSDYRETVSEELKMLSGRLELIEIKTPLILESDQTDYGYLRDLYSPWKNFLARLHVCAKRREIEGARRIRL